MAISYMHLRRDRLRPFLRDEAAQQLTTPECSGNRV